MTHNINSEKQKDLLKTLDLAKEGEIKLKEISRLATELSQKCQSWYDEGIARKQKE